MCSLFWCDACNHTQLFMIAIQCVVFSWDLCMTKEGNCTNRPRSKWNSKSPQPTNIYSRVYPPPQSHSRRPKTFEYLLDKFESYKFDNIHIEFAHTLACAFFTQSPKESPPTSLVCTQLNPLQSSSPRIYHSFSQEIMGLSSSSEDYLEIPIHSFQQHTLTNSWFHTLRENV